MSETLFTAYLFPEKCSIGVVECKIPETSTQHRFGFMEINLDLENSSRFDEIYNLIRKSRSLRMVHLPGSMDEKEATALSTIVLSFHQSLSDIETYNDPLFAAIVHVDDMEDADTLSGFSKQVVQDGHFCLSLMLESQMLFLFLVEISAISEPVIRPEFQALVASFIGEPTFYAEYTPPLTEPLDQLIHAVEHYRESFINQDDNGTVNLTGLIPEGLA